MLFQLIQRILRKLLDLDSAIAQDGVATRKLLGTLDALAAARHRDQMDLLRRILAAVEPAPAVKFVITTELDGQITSGVEFMKITASQKFTASIQPVDAKGNPAEVQAGSVQWEGPDTLTITPSEDGLSAEIAAKGPLGSGQVSVSADADLGEGVTTIAGTLQVDVVAGQAVSLGVNTSDPVEQ